MPAAARGAPGSLMYFLKYTQTQENSADQAAMTFLERTHQSVKGTIEFLRVLQREERMMIGRRDPYLSTHPLTPDRIAFFEEAAARSPYTNAPESAQFLDMHHRIVAKLMGFLTPGVALQRYAEGDRAVPARYARAIALYRQGALGSALLTIDGLLKEYPNDPYFHELRGQMLFENGRAAESVPSYRRAVQLLPAVGIVKVDFARALLETNKPDDDREAVRNLELASQTEFGQLRPVAPDGRGLLQAQQSRHDLACARRDGGPSRQPGRGAGPCRHGRAPAPARHARLAARPGPQGLHQFPATPEISALFSE